MIARALRATAGAFSFLTILPVGRFAPDGEDIARGATLFPLVGGLVGAASAGTAWILGSHLPVLVAAAVAVGAEVALTGAMHVDALADTFDAIGGFDRQRALEIMRDHTIGSFGAGALVLDLVLRVGCIASLIGSHRLSYVIAAAALSRAVSVPMGVALPYARPEGGSGSIFAGLTWVSGLVSVVLGVTATVVLVGMDALVLFVAVLIAALLLGIWFQRWLGGVTGDTLGAATELCGVLALVVATWIA